MTTRWRFGARALVLSVVAFGTLSCGGGRKASGAGSKADAGTTGAQCTTDNDCASKVPATTPAGCAVGKCNTVQGVCEFVARDADGDGHPTADCTANDGTPIQTGDDCNDDNPALYPGHSAPCSVLPDGGVAVWPTGSPTGVCHYGTISCGADGKPTACSGTVVPAKRDCGSSLDNDCDGKPDNSECVCMPGATRCSGNGVETCSALGAWGAVVACVNSSCVGGSASGPTDAGPDGSADAGTEASTDAASEASQEAGADPGGGGTTALCQGGCAPGQTNCSGNGLQQCVGGTWGTPITCTGQTCVVSAPGTATCKGVCEPNTYRCSGPQPQMCDPTGNWADNGGACAGQACVATSARCQGSCTPNATQACGPCSLGSQGCDGSGSWGTCSGAGCKPNTSAACTTCSTIGPLQAGSEVCTASCGPGPCYPQNSTTWTGSQGDFDHGCGSTVQGWPNAWQGAWDAAGTGYTSNVSAGCPIQYGPYATLPPGTYSLTVTYSAGCRLTYPSDTICPNIDLATMDVTHDQGVTEDAKFGLSGGNYGYGACNAGKQTTATVQFSVPNTCTQNYEFRVISNYDGGGTTINGMYTYRNCSVTIFSTSLTYVHP